ncbi:MAG: beta-propeller fold lactonase family protein [bacterium]|nr:beta-propeller fold lactonase family protein [bacterium]
MMRAAGCFVIGAVLLAAAVGAFAVDRIYMGEAACRECHNDVTYRNQFNRWRLSKHAAAYAALGKPEAAEIARLSGVDVDPFKSPICLGCHTTAPDTEAWRRDAGFHFEDGMQCEACHGPGSEYMDEAIMKNPVAARAAGLRMPGERFCLICHKDKGSHTSVLGSKPFVYEDALKEIQHLGEDGPLIHRSREKTAPLEGPKYIGALACSECHLAGEAACSFSLWRTRKHSFAYAALGTARARELALERGITSNPQDAPVCLECHTAGFGEPAGRFLESFDAADGVQCESCHGPGSEYASREVMLDREASRKAGLREVSEQTCVGCHESERAHGKAFDPGAAMLAIRPPKAEYATEPEYKTPWNLAVSHDGKTLYVACEASDSLMVVDTESGAVLREIEIQNQPHGVCLSADERRVYVSNRGSDSVSEIDAATFDVLRTLSTGDEPHGLYATPDGKTLYVVNCGSEDVSVIDLASGLESKRLTAARGAWAIMPSADGVRLFVTNNLSHFVGFREPSLSEVSVIDARRGVVRDRRMFSGANLIQGVAASPDGEITLCTLIRTKNLVPMTRVTQGWVMTNGLGVIWKDGRTDQLLIDGPDRFFADPTDVVFRADGRYAYVSGGGVNQVAVIDVEKLKAVLNAASDRDRKERLPNHFGVSTEYVIARIPVGNSPRGLAASPDGRFIYVADGLDDAISVIDARTQQRVRVIDLGGPREITETREGERIFHSALVTFGRQFSCHSCHPDGGIDAITYDIEPDGIGVQPVDNRSLRGILDTAPFKWEGTNPTLKRQCGPRLAVFFTRIDPFTPEQAQALDRYICTIPLPPNRFRTGDQLTDPQRRGKAIFYRTTNNRGEEIPEANRCSTCHPAPFYTSREVADVGTQSPLDVHGEFDVPQLNNCYQTAPYLHDGRVPSLEEIWTRFNPYDTHGVTNDMTKDQLNDLVEFLKTL